MANTKPARGMRDFLPADVRKRNYVIGIIKEVYESYGFEPLETPAVENIETLTGKYGEEGNQLIFKVLKRGEKLLESVQSPKSKVQSQKTETLDLGLETLDSLSDLALRYDLTVPLARVVANNRNELPKFFKRYQIQPVWRADRPARGRFREFYQCDVDAIGSSSTVVEAELISAVKEILFALRFTDFVTRVNHRNILFAMLNVVEISQQKQPEAITFLDKYDKVGVEGVAEGFARLRLSKNFEDLMRKLQRYFAERRTLSKFLVENPDDPQKRMLAYDYYNSSVLDILSEIVESDLAGRRAIAELNEIAILSGGHFALNRILIDPLLARGLSYYTGAIMEINVPDLAGSLGGGGRYDGLIGMFGKEQIPACGFSLGLERILVIMEERNMFPAEVAATSADVMVTIWNEKSIGESLKLASELRRQGLRVIVYPEADKLGKQFKYASQIKVSYVCVLGETEIAGNKVTLKNMETGDQEIIDAADVAKRIAIKE